MSSSDSSNTILLTNKRLNALLYIFSIVLGMVTELMFLQLKNALLPIPYQEM